jgi:TM2 domain-containing membrane protein YozV
VTLEPERGDLVLPGDPPVDLILVLVLNLLLFGGVGSIVLGQKTKGIVAIVVWMAGLFTFGIVSFLVAVGGAADGYLQAQQLQAGHPVGQWTFFNSHK